MHEHLVEQPRSLGQVQADALRVKQQGLVVWVAMAMCVQTRLWLGREISPHRDRHLLRPLMERLRRSAVCQLILFCRDGLSTYVMVIGHVLRDAVQSGRPGRPRLQQWSGLLMAQVVKGYQRRRVVAVERRIKRRTAAQVEAVRYDGGEVGGVINRSYIERLNGTFRQRRAPLVRRGRALARQTASLCAGLFLVGTVYNFCTAHQSLTVRPRADEPHVPRTPAMAAGLTDHCWSVKELMSYRVPPPRWTPPKRRGGRSVALQQKIDRWCQVHR